MTGWFEFAIEMKRSSKSVELELLLDSDNYEILEKNGFVCIILSSWCEQRTTDRLADLFISSNLKGYFLIKNDTTDTCTGMIRLEEDNDYLGVQEDITEKFYDDEELTEEDLQIPRVPLFQFSSPSRWDINELLNYYNFPLCFE